MPLRITDTNFEAVMSIYGTPLKYYPSRLCSCVAENGGLPKIGCSCILGYYYETAQDIQGVRQRVSYKRTNSPSGVIFDGGAQFSIPKFVDSIEQPVWKRLAKGDVISVVDKFRRETEILKKGVHDKLFAFDVTEIISVTQKNNVVYVQGRDFDLVGATIAWRNDATITPAELSDYVVEYTCNQQYVVWEDGAKDRGTIAEDLPRLVLCVLRRYISKDTNPIDSIPYSQDLY